MEAVNTKYVSFAPDVGQLQKGGSDAAQVVKDLARIATHMHLKDCSKGKYMAGYYLLGMVDIESILHTLDAAIIPTRCTNSIAETRPCRPWIPPLSAKASHQARVRFEAEAASDRPTPPKVSAAIRDAGEKRAFTFPSRRRCNKVCRSRNFRRALLR
jgi:hypothetical protein